MKKGMFLFAICILASVLFFDNASASDVIVVQKFYAGSGDGHCLREDYNTYSPTNWDSTHDHTQCTTVDSSGSSTFVWSQWWNPGTKWGIGRAFLPFDTSSLPSSPSILYASVNLYIISKQNLDNDGDDWINVVQTSQASTSSLSVGDYDQCGSINNPTEGSTRVDIGDITLNSYLELELNSTGISWIDSSGTTMLGMREGHDAIDDLVTANSSSYANIIHWSSSEETGTGQDPYLLIAYVCDQGDVPAEGDVVFTTPYYPADYNNDSVVDAQDITDYLENQMNIQKETINLWINHVWQNGL